MRSLCIIYVLTSFTFIFDISDGAEQTPFDTNDSDDDEDRPPFNFATQPEPTPVQLNRDEHNPSVGMSTVTRNTLIGTINLHPLPGVKTPCVSHLPFYPVYIAKEFADGLIKVSGYNKNIDCYCGYGFTDLMFCDIYVRPYSDQERMIKKRFESATPETIMRLRPFFTLPRGRLPYRWPDHHVQILYAHPSCMPIVTAYISIFRLDILPLIRSESHTARLETPIKYIALSQCTRQEGATDQAICPIMMTSFEIDEFVYVLKRDYNKVLEGKSVVCICFAGMIGLEKQRDDLLFQDPLRRLGNTPSSIRDDYDLYRIIPDPPESCQGNGAPSESSSLEQHVALSLQYNIRFLRCLFIFLIIFILIASFYYNFVYTLQDSHEVYIEFEPTIA